jgi:cobalt/nickel transport protein
MKKVVLLSALALLVAAFPAFAHFQLLYTPETLLEQGGRIELKMVFTHPFEGSPSMNMGQPEEFFVVTRGEKTDLKESLTPIMWGGESMAKAYEAAFPVRRMGDYVFCLVPAPYYEEREDAYIQQFTKLIVNNGGLPTDWEEEIGMKAEIIPLTKPYALWTGNVFSGIVMGDSKPVPYAEIEVEYLNHEPLMEKNAFAKEGAIEPPHEAFETLVIKSNANGEFVFGIPKAGWWGFAALGVGPDTELNGKELSQDAVIWIQAVDMK